MDHHAWHVLVRCYYGRTSDGLSQGDGDSGLPDRCILRQCVLHLERRRDREETARTRRATTHNCVSTRSVCGQLDNVMNVDIFPNADITYDPSPSPVRCSIPLLSSRLVVPPR